MTNTVLIKRSSTANSVPTAGQLLPGELAINYADGNLFYKNSSNVVTTIASNKFSSVTGNVTGGNVLSNGQLSAAGNITGSNITTGGTITAIGNISAPWVHGSYYTGIWGTNFQAIGNVSATGNVLGGNITTAGIISATGTITSGAVTNATAFAVGNGAVSNVGLGFFPTAGTPGDYAIRDYSTVTNSIYLDVGMGGTAAGSFQFRTTNAYTQLAVINSSGVNTSLAVSATGNVTGGNINTAGSVYGTELWSTNSVGSEGGQINLALPATGTSISGGIIIDVYNNQLRFFERSGTNRGAYIDLTAAAAGVGSNLLAGGSSSTPTQIVNGTSNVSVTSSGNITANVAGAWSASFYSSGIIANTVWANNNGTGQNFKVGDDAWIGDINLADTMRVMGQQNAANAYIVFGNADGTQLGRAGTGPLTYGGAFSAVGNITGNYILGNGSLLTGIITSVANINNGTSNVTVVSSGGNITVGVGGTSNVVVWASTGEYVTGVISATGNIVGNRIAVAAGTAAAPSVQFSNDIAADTGFYWVSDGNIGVTTNGTLRATFLDTGLSVVGNVTSGNVITGGVVTATGNVAAANFTTGGNVVATGNVSGGNVAAVTNIFSFGTVQGTGNVSGGNLTTGGQVSATGNITGGNVLGGANVNATTHTGTTVSVTGNVTGGNILTGGLISATGNITGGNITANEIFYNSITIDNSFTTPAGFNGMVAGPVSLANGIVGTVSNGTTWQVLG